MKTKEFGINDARNKKKKTSWSVRSIRDLSPDSKHENLFCNANGTPSH